jgi:hypothetical protein
VRDVSHEIAPHGIDALLRGDVARIQQLLLLAELDHPDGERGIARAKRERLAEIAGPEKGHEIGLADEVDHRLAQIAPDVDAEVVRGGRVGPFDPVLPVEDHDTVGKGAHRGAEARKRLAEAFLLGVAPLEETVQLGERLFPYPAPARQRLELRPAQPAAQGGQVELVIRDADDEHDRDRGQYNDGYAHAGLAEKRYPDPRTVSISRSWPEGSRAFLSRRICTSTVRSSTNT